MVCGREMPREATATKRKNRIIVNNTFERNRSDGESSAIISAWFIYGVNSRRESA